MTINCDLGEGVAHENEILAFIDKASIACGGHFGNKETILSSLSFASSFSVKCGAHPSFPDQANFGRKPMNLKPSQLLDTLCIQLELFLVCAQKSSTTIDHVKAHGALYNTLMEDMKLAEILLKAMEKLNIKCPIFALFDSPFYHEFNRYFPLIQEAFIDRKYTEKKRLASRSIPGSLITEPEIAAHQFHAFKDNTFISTIENKKIKIKPDTACIHGDNPAAISILHHIKSEIND